MSRRFASARRLSVLSLTLLAAVFISSRALAGPVLPNFSASNFASNAPIDNKFFPIVPGTTFKYGANVSDPESGDTGFERDEDFVTNQRTNIGGVNARVVHSRVWLDDVLVEDTLDYYAQDKSGNVWYMGEDTKEFEYDDNGKVIGTDTTGSWRTGVNGAKPGFIMPANPTVGFSYFQESAPNDEALDQAEVASLNESVSVPAGDFTNALKTLETTELEPGNLEAKFYAAGVGPVLILENIGADGTALNRIPLLSVTTANAIPLPPAVWSGMLTITLALMVAAVNVRRRAMQEA